MDTGSFAFTAFAGVPALELSFVEVILSWPPAVLVMGAEKLEKKGFWFDVHFTLKSEVCFPFCNFNDRDPILIQLWDECDLSFDQ